MIVKLEAVQDRGGKGISKKIKCPEHDFRYVYKCSYPGCESPFICSTFECIDSHAHEEEKVIMTRFKTESIASKFYEMENLIADDSLHQNARILKNYIDSLKESIRSIYTGIKTLNTNYDYLKGDLESSLNIEYITKVQHNYTLNKNVRSSIEALKEKVKLEFPVKDSFFALRSYLIEFLSQNIKGFFWPSAKEVYSSKSEPTTIQKFHEKLAGMSKLLFVFVGDTKVIGSYFEQPYPSLTQRECYDPESFIFISGRNKDQTKFAKFNALEQRDQHLTASDKNYICQGNTPSYGDGIRTFQRNFDSLQYCLPSNSFANESMSNETFSGTLKVRRFMILQLTKTEATNGDQESV